MNRILKNTKKTGENLLKKGFAWNKIVLQQKSRKALLVVLFLVFGFLATNNFALATSGGVAPLPATSTAQQTAPAVNNAGNRGNNTGTTPLAPTSTDQQHAAAANNAGGQGGRPPGGNADGTCGITDIGCFFRMLLVGVLNVVGWLFGIAATLFTWVTDPNNISNSGQTGVLQKQAVKDVWIMVRDMLNMAFILVLLFAAFCTIFQVEKWNLKKVWLGVLINALLVNFSFPIARFFIDVSNVAFYYLVNHLFSSTNTVTGGGIFAMFGGASGISNLLVPTDYAKFDIAYLIAMIVIVFIMGMTLMVVAALFVVRLVALIMLVMFSPIGFVGYISPSTTKYADEWWSTLFSYSFFAPIMIFFMAVAIRVTEAIGKENMQAFMANASKEAPADQAGWIAQAAFLVVPIVILWTGIGVAKGMSIAGADQVVKRVKEGGKWIANAPGHYSGVYGASKKAAENFNKKGKLFGMKVPLMGSEGREAREAAMAGFVTGGAGGYKDARRNVEDKKISEQMKEYKDRNYTSDQIAKDLDSSDKITQMAAVRALMAEKGALGADPNRMIKALNIAGSDMALRNKVIDGADNFAGNDAFTHVHLNSILNAATAGLVAGSQQEKDISGKIKGKIKKENAKKLIDYEVNHLGKNVTNAYKDSLESLNAEDFGKQKGLHENIGTDVNLQNYIINHVAPDVGFHQEMFKNMKKGNRTEYINNGLHP